jgi:hypothetical protein
VAILPLLQACYAFYASISVVVAGAWVAYFYFLNFEIFAALFTVTHVITPPASCVFMKRGSAILTTRLLTCLGRIIRVFALCLHDFNRQYK